MYSKRNSINLLGFISFFLIITTSCKKPVAEADLTTDKLSLKSNMQLKLTLQEQNTLMEEFASLLSQVVRDDKDVRLFLKEEANKQITLDYDILYHMVKDKKISKDESLHEKLKKYVQSDELLTQIESQLPLLTILIPELPSGFSAKTWNAESEIPAISTGIPKNKTVSFIMADGKKVSAKHDLIPGFPLLVIKTNDRIQLASKGMGSQAYSDSQSLLSSEMFSYEFVSENFNGLKLASKSENLTMATAMADNKVVSAYNMWAYQYPGQDLWQRDYIYYSISPTSVDGPLDPSFQEHLTSLKFKDGVAAYTKITDQNDPRVVQGFGTGWTEGSYEFSLTVLINSTSGLGSSITKLFPVRPQDLFDITYRMEIIPGGYQYFYVTGVTPKRVILNHPIAAWDIRTTGVAWKLILSEVDPSQTQTYQNSVSTQLAANFGIDGTGLWTKLGLRFGASATQTTNNTYTLVTQMDDDQLGEASLYFYNPVIISGNDPNFNFYDADTGWAWLTIEPKKVF